MWQGTIEERPKLFIESKVCMRGWNINDINRESQCVKGKRNETARKNTGLRSRQVQNVAQITNILIFDKATQENKTRKEISNSFLERNVFQFWKDQGHRALNVTLKRSVRTDKGSNYLLLIRPHLPTLVTNSGD